VEGVILDTVVFRMLKRMGVYGQKIDRAVSRVAVFQRHDLAEKRKAARRAARHNRATASTRRPAFILHPTPFIS
jgi:hypothetical protein